MPVNCVSWNRCPDYAHQFVTVDDMSRVSLWSAKTGKKIVSETASNGLLMTATIEPRNGKFLICGGIDTKLHLYEINKVVAKRENAKLMTKMREFTGHQGLVTSSGFLSNEYFVSGSNDSSINLWEVE